MEITICIILLTNSINGNTHHARMCFVYIPADSNTKCYIFLPHDKNHFEIVYTIEYPLPNEKPKQIGWKNVAYSTVSRDLLLCLTELSLRGGVVSVTL